MQNIDRETAQLMPMEPLVELAEAGNLTAQIELGTRYFLGTKFEPARHWALIDYRAIYPQMLIKLPINERVEKNIELAEKYYQSAAAQGSLEAKSHLGALYLMEFDGKHEIAFKLLKEALDGGFYKASYLLWTYDPKSPPIHRETTRLMPMQLLVKLAEFGNVEANVELGTRYFLGTSVDSWGTLYNSRYILTEPAIFPKVPRKELASRNIKLAEKYYQYAAEQGSLEAKSHLGFLYLLYYDRKTDIAIELLQEALKGGFYKASNALWASVKNIEEDLSYAAQHHYLWAIWQVNQKREPSEWQILSENEVSQRAIENGDIDVLEKLTYFYRSEIDKLHRKNNEALDLFALYQLQKNQTDCAEAILDRIDLECNDIKNLYNIYSILKHSLLNFTSQYTRNEPNDHYWENIFATHSENSTLSQTELLELQQNAKLLAKRFRIIDERVRNKFFKQTKMK